MRIYFAPQIYGETTISRNKIITHYELRIDKILQTLLHLQQKFGIISTLNIFPKNRKGTIIYEEYKAHFRFYRGTYMHFDARRLRKQN